MHNRVSMCSGRTRLLKLRNNSVIGCLVGASGIGKTRASKEIINILGECDTLCEEVECFIVQWDFSLFHIDTVTEVLFKYLNSVVKLLNNKLVTSMMKNRKIELKQ